MFLNLSSFEGITSTVGFHGTHFTILSLSAAVVKDLPLQLIYLPPNN
jgi:hypothetical protein